MRVLDRVLDTAESDSDAAPGVVAAAAKAKADPGMHDTISLLLAQQQGTGSWKCWRRALAAAREARSDDRMHSITGWDTTGPIRRVFSSCAHASRAAGEPDSQTAAALAELLLGAIVVEMSSLGADRGRQLRNRADHSDVATVRTLWRNLADQQPETRP
jgi:hypothetical protein